MIPTRIGQIVSGCMFVGVNWVKNCAYAILVSPTNTETRLQFKLNHTRSSKSQSVVDGYFNTHRQNNSLHPAAQYCASLVVNGSGNFYLPAKNELELCYRFLKPTSRANFTYSNNTHRGNLSTPCGSNNSSIPVGAPYTEQTPEQTQLIDLKFKFTTNWYLTSTESSAGTALSLMQYFSNGVQHRNYKTAVYRVRAIRRHLIIEINRGNN